MLQNKGGKFAAALQNDVRGGHETECAKPKYGFHLIHRLRGPPSPTGEGYCNVSSPYRNGIYLNRADFLIVIVRSVYFFIN